MLAGCLPYWLLTTRLEAACYLNWKHSSRESQRQGSAMGEWRMDSWGRGGVGYMCHTGIVQTQEVEGGERSGESEKVKKK